MNFLALFLLFALVSTLVYARLPTQCCAPGSTENCLPQCVRKSYAQLTPQEWMNLGAAFEAISKSENGPSFLSRVAKEHAVNFNEVHSVKQELFFPFHRLLLAEVEMELNKAVPGTCLPYFDYIAEKRNLFASPLFNKDTMGTLNAPCDQCITEGVFKGMRFNDPSIKFKCIQRCFPKNQAEFENRLKTVMGMNSFEAAVDPAYEPNFLPYSKRVLSSHGVIHGFFFKLMMAGESPLDPAFFFLHSNVEKLHAAAFNDPTFVSSMKSFQTPMPVYGGTIPSSYDTVPTCYSYHGQPSTTPSKTIPSPPVQPPTTPTQGTSSRPQVNAGGTNTPTSSPTNKSPTDPSSGSSSRVPLTEKNPSLESEDPIKEGSSITTVTNKDSGEVKGAVSSIKLGKNTVESLSLKPIVSWSIPLALIVFYFSLQLY